MFVTAVFNSPICLMTSVNPPDIDVGRVITGKVADQFTAETSTLELRTSIALANLSVIVVEESLGIIPIKELDVYCGYCKLCTFCAIIGIGCTSCCNPAISFLFRQICRDTSSTNCLLFKI